MFTIRCLRPYHLKWNVQNAYASFLTVDSKESIYEILNDPEKEPLLRKTLGPEHPYCVFGKRSYKNCYDSCIKKQFDSTAYSNSGTYFHQIAKLKKTLTKSDLELFPGIYKFNFINDVKYPLVYNEKNVHSLVYIDSRCSKVVEKASFIELDCSFYALEPYVYCIPMAIINNESLPLGLSVGPSESLEIYENFFNLFTEKYPDVKIYSLPLLSDEGKPLKSFAGKHEIVHFFCYRHLINKFGASTELGNIVRELLFSFSEEEFNEKLNNYEKRLKKLLNPNSPHLKQFQNLFNVCLYPEVPIHKYTPQGIWFRSKYNVATCSNHIESSHQKLNYKVLIKAKNVNEHLLYLLQYISQKYETVKNSRNAHDAIKTLKKLKQDYDIGSCTDHCHAMRNFYTCLYGFDFPCVHTIDCFNEKDIKEIPEFVADTSIEVIEEYPRIENWKFPEDKNELKFNLGIDEIQWQDNNKPSWKAISFLKIIFKDYTAKKNEVKHFIINSFIHFSYNVYGAYHYEEKCIELFDQYLRNLINNKKPEEFMMKCKVQSQQSGTWKLPEIPKNSSCNIIFETESHTNTLFKKEVLDSIAFDGKFNDYCSSYVKEKKFVGLQNLGATCYINSLLQILYNIPEFRLNTYTCSSRTDMIRELQCLFCSLEFSKHPVTIRKFINTFGRSIELFEGQDYNEFSIMLFEKLKESIGTIQSLFQGRSKSIIKCTDIDYSSEVYDTFFDVSLDVSHFTTIESSLEYFTQENILTGDNKYDLGNDEKHEAVFKTEIIELPRILTFHLKRFEYDEEAGEVIKNNTEFKYGKSLDMYPYISKGSYYPSLGSIEYELFGVVTHTGNAKHGHYYVFIRPFICSDEDKWLKFNDSCVEESSDFEAIDQNFGNIKKHYSAYILYYIRKDAINDIIYNPLKRITSHDFRIIPQAIKEIYAKITKEYEVQQEIRSFDYIFMLVSAEGLNESARRGSVSWNYPNDFIGCSREATIDNLFSIAGKKTGIEKNKIRIFSITCSYYLGNEITHMHTVDQLIEYDALFITSRDVLSYRNDSIHVPVFLYIPDIKDPIRFLWIETKQINEPILSLFQRVYEVYGKGKLNAYIARDRYTAEHVSEPCQSFKKNYVVNGSIFILEYSEFYNEKQVFPNIVDANRENKFSERDTIKFKYYTQYKKRFPSSFAEFIKFKEKGVFLMLTMQNGMHNQVYVPQNITFKEFRDFIAVAFNMIYNPFSDSILLYPNNSKTQIEEESEDSSIIVALSNATSSGKITSIIVPSCSQDFYAKTLRMEIKITKRERTIIDTFSFIVSCGCTCADIVSTGIKKNWFQANSIVSVFTCNQDNILLSHPMQQRLDEIPNPIRIAILGDYMEVIGDYDEEISVVLGEKERNRFTVHNFSNSFPFHIYMMETICSIKTRITEYINEDNEIKNKKICKSLFKYNPRSREYSTFKDEDILCSIMDVKTEFLCIECDS